MTEPAAIQASYADYRRVKGRKVLQLVLEVPLEMAPQVHEAFGEPLPDGSTWVAVVRIDAGLEDAISTGHLRKGGKLAQRAGILCNEGAFQKFIDKNYLNKIPGEMNQTVDDKRASFWVREICGILSRAELDHNEDAARKFRDLELEYNAWKTT